MYIVQDGKDFFMGLCESNFCKTVLGPDPPGLQRGNGRLVVAEKTHDKEMGCVWEPTKVWSVNKKSVEEQRCGVWTWMCDIWATTIHRVIKCWPVGG